MFRILSIDGGGIKGTFPASFLTGLQESLQLPITDYFDLIVGTSTGGIIAIGLGLGMSPSEILDFYISNGSSIFPASQKWSARLKHYFRNKYSQDPLRNSLKLAFKERLLGHSKKRLVIPSFSALTGKIYVYKTPHDVRFESDWRKSAVEVAMATSAAPSYFPPYINPSFIAHLDGGMWANNPTGNGVVEAIGILGIDRKDIRVLSIGCTRIPESFALKNAGMIGWRKKALDASLSGQSFGSMGTAAVLIGHANIQRVDPTVEPGRFALDDSRYVKELEGLGREWAREELPKFRAMFDHGPTEPFVPLHGPGSLN
jgi:patatin-like phospholipase/acyl hydrolase